MSKEHTVKTKIVGRIRLPGTPAENVLRAAKLEREVQLLNPFPRPRGFVFKAKTWDEWEAWKASQKNPRLW